MSVTYDVNNWGFKCPENLILYNHVIFSIKKYAIIYWREYGKGKDRLGKYRLWIYEDR